LLSIHVAKAAQATFKSIRSLVPLFDRVLVQRFKPETVRPFLSNAFVLSLSNDGGSIGAQKTASGIFLPTSATSSPLPEATVIAVGPGAPDKEGRIVPTSVKAGDRVLLPGWGGNAIKVGEEVRSAPPMFLGGVFCSFFLGGGVRLIGFWSIFF
jgi:chaperonin GroES